MKEIFEGWVTRDRDNGLYVADTKPYLADWVITDSKKWIKISPTLGKAIVPDLNFGDEPRIVKITIEIFE